MWNQMCNITNTWTPVLSSLSDIDHNSSILLLDLKWKAHFLEKYNIYYENHDLAIARVALLVLTLG